MTKVNNKHMKILVVNSGSSSIKYQLISIPEKEVICKGLVERIGYDNAVIHFKSAKYSFDMELPIPDHQAGLEKVAGLLLDSTK